MKKRWANRKELRCGRGAARVGAFVIALLRVAPLAAADGVVDKSGHHLFDPTPPELLRELSADRPDLTESPFTVDAGHFQIEMDFANGEIDRDRSSGSDMHSQLWNFGSINLKAGLLNNVDLQFVLDGYVAARVTDRAANQGTDESGFGDVQTRLKVNLWGNDGGKTAFAIMPFVKWPLPQSSVRNGKTEGGVVFPLAIELPHGWGMGLMTEIDFVRDESNGFDPEYFNTVAFSHHIAGDLGGYVEFAALFTPASDAQWQGQAGVGFTYGWGANTQFDLGCNFGVTRTAPDFNPFIGLTRRF